MRLVGDCLLVISGDHCCQEDEDKDKEKDKDKDKLFQKGRRQDG